VEQFSPRGNIMHRFVRIERGAIAALALFVIPTGAYAQTSSKVLVATGTEVETSRVFGTIVCIGGQPATDPQGPPCSPGTTRFLMSSTVRTNRFQNLAGSAASLLEGATTTDVTHCNADGTYYGHCWGHSLITVPAAGGQWEGTWSGMFDMLTNTSSWSAILYGFGGKLDGLQLRIEGASTAPGQPQTIILKVNGH
jgi:hypothetical protein